MRLPVYWKAARSSPPAWEGGACERGTGRVAEWGAVRDGAVVYVPACNLPEFVAGAFAALNASSRIVLVSGGVLGKKQGVGELLIVLSWLER